MPDQGAAGLHAPLDDAGDDAHTDVHREFSGGKVVEKKQRLGALDHDVVDAHRDQVDADGIVAASIDRET
jgi:hypothetical protein